MIEKHKRSTFRRRAKPYLPGIPYIKVIAFALSRFRPYVCRLHSCTTTSRHFPNRYSCLRCHDVCCRVTWMKQLIQNWRSRHYLCHLWSWLLSWKRALFFVLLQTTNASEIDLLLTVLLSSHYCVSSRSAVYQHFTWAERGGQALARHHEGLKDALKNSKYSNRENVRNAVNVTLIRVAGLSADRTQGQ